MTASRKTVRIRFYMLLHAEEIEEFNSEREANEDFSVLKGLDFRGLDLRGCRSARL